MDTSLQTAPIGYSDGGLIRGSYRINIDGASFFLKEGKVQNPHREDKEYGLNGQPDSAHYVKDFSSMPVTIMNKQGMANPEGKRFKPFGFFGDAWVIVSTEFAFSAAGLQVWTGEIKKLVNDPVEPVYADA